MNYISDYQTYFMV